MSIDVRRGDKFSLLQKLVWSNGDPIDLTEYTSVNFRAEKDGDSSVIISKMCVISDATEGIVLVNFDDTDLDVLGMYRVVWVLLDSLNDDQLTIPTQGKQWMHVQDSVYPIE